MEKDRPKRRVSMRLAARPDGRFAKVIDGQYHYFGSGGDRDAALRELADFIRLRDRGHVPSQQSAGPATVAEICQKFINNRNARLIEGGITGGTFDDYKVAVEQFAAAVNAGVLVDDLLPEDFGRVRAAWSARMGSWALDRHVQAVRTMFRWAAAHRLIGREPFYGDRFGKASAAERRQEKRESVGHRGERVFTIAEVVVILGGVKDDDRDVPPLSGQMLAMVLLGLNVGLYSKDVSDLRRHDLKQEGKTLLIDSHRQKTGVPRRAPLWPETVAALERVPTTCCRHEDDATRVFCTHHGRPWNRNGIDSISMMFARRLRDLGIKRPGIGFGTLRHTHVSAVGDHPDLVAARLVRAHKITSIESHYDTPSLARLLAVTNLARKRLLPASPATSTQKRRGAASSKRAARATTRGHA
jgi:integrase